MGPYSSGNKSIQISYDFQEKDKELDSQELPLLPLQGLYWPSWFHIYSVVKSHHLLNVYETFQSKTFYLYDYFTFYIYCKNS